MTASRRGRRIPAALEREMVGLLRSLAADGDPRAEDLVARLDAALCETSHIPLPLSADIRLEDLVRMRRLPRETLAVLVAAASAAARPAPTCLGEVAALDRRQILMAPGGSRRVILALTAALAAAGLSLAAPPPPARPRRARLGQGTHQACGTSNRGEDGRGEGRQALPTSRAS